MEAYSTICSGNVACDRPFKKCMAWGGSPQGPRKPNMLHFGAIFPALPLPFPVYPPIPNSFPSPSLFTLLLPHEGEQET